MVLSRRLCEIARTQWEVVMHAHRSIASVLPISLALAALVVGVVAVTATGASTTSTTITLTPTGDTYTYQGAKSTNFGSSLTLATSGLKGKVKKTYLSFSVTDVPAGATVTGARIVLTALNSSGVRPQLKRQTAGSWTESTLTFANAPADGSA